MEVEIRTISGTWLTRVDDVELQDGKAGDAARRVRDAIQSGRPIEIFPAADDDMVRRPRHGTGRMAVFNPGHVVCVIEPISRRRGRSF